MSLGAPGSRGHSFENDEAVNYSCRYVSIHLVCPLVSFLSICCHAMLWPSFLPSYPGRSCFQPRIRFLATAHVGPFTPFRLFRLRRISAFQPPASLPDLSTVDTESKILFCCPAQASTVANFSVLAVASKTPSTFRITLHRRQRTTTPTTLTSPIRCLALRACQLLLTRPRHFVTSL